MNRQLPPHLAVMKQLFDQMVEPTRTVIRGKPYSCNACRDSGDTESGRGCNWCGADGPWNGEIDGTED